MKREKVHIGWREWLALPTLQIPAIKAKIDTGARTSALHVFFVESFELDKVTMVRFGIHPLQKNTDISLTCEAPVIDERLVTDSGGHREMRFVIETMAVFRGIEWPIEVTLTNRDHMRFRMLLGRTALAETFLVDPGASYCGGRGLGKIYKKRSL